MLSRVKRSLLESACADTWRALCSHSHLLSIDCTIKGPSVSEVLKY